MLRGEDADRLHVGLYWGVADPLQLNTELIDCQQSPNTVVHIQQKELSPRGENTWKQDWITSWAKSRAKDIQAPQGLRLSVCKFLYGNLINHKNTVTPD